jgi:hypothetical protein
MEIPGGTAATALTSPHASAEAWYRILSATQANCYGECDSSGSGTYEMEILCFKSVSGGYSLTAEAGSCAVTGTAASLLRGSKVSAEAGSCAVTGTAASLLRGSKVSAEAGSCAVTGTAASLLRGSKVSAEAGSCAVTGTAASLLRGLLISAGEGWINHTGSSAVLIYDQGPGGGYLIVIDSGSFAVAGTAAVLKKDSIISAASSSYAGTGTVASLLRGLSLSAEAGSYSISGSSASLLHSRGGSPWAPWAYAIIGSDATLRYSQDYVLDCDPSSYAVTGLDVSLSRNVSLAPAAGAFLLSGQDTDLILGDRTLTADAGVFTFTIQAANLISSQLLAAGLVSTSYLSKQAAISFEVKKSTINFITIGD